ncbi:ATP-grasp domain-containing protein [Aquabacterium sp. OR-4]|uniref:ATP-grasp domain-containing protein n=1 Tax=Aquabacterium sp. OR-4 TaxID=2978127 RepID=UPI0021B1CB25|nr:ATP-grasp domain-containing protein [Aquabacterium sp. OR-4]MDT7838291.1 ATP-grasp domain-containing protein [Aquabacterium sp. OR-4]
MRQVFVYEHVSGAAPLAAGLGAAPADDAELLAAGLAMRDALARDLLACPHTEVVVASASGMPAPPPGARVQAPAPGEPAQAFVARQARRHGLVWVIAPETDGLLAGLQAVVPAEAWLGCSPAAIALTSRKQATLGHLARHGVPTPWRFGPGAQAGRWVVKPDDGAGALATWRHDDLASALADQARRAASGRVSTLEPWVDGEALSLSLLCSHAGFELLSVNRQHIEVDAAGQVSYAGVSLCALGPGDPRHAPLATLAARVVAAVPGLLGFVGIDCVWHAREGAVFIELNPRLTCAYDGLSAALGRNLAADWIHSLAPPVGPPAGLGSPARAKAGHV